MKVFKSLSIVFFTLLLCGMVTLQAGELDKLLRKSQSLNYRQIRQAVEEQGLYSRFTEKERKHYDRWNWFWRYRTGKDGDMTAAGKNAARFLEEMLNDPQTFEGNSISVGSTASTPSWTAVGPTLPLTGNHQKGIGRVECIWADPDDYNFIIIGTATGGVWKTTNGGSSWTPLTDNLITIGVSDIEVDPTNHNIIYLASGVQTNGLLRGKYGVGVLKTTNGGSSWSATNIGIDPEDQQMVLELLISPANPNVLFAMTAKQIYHTSNGGANWIVVADINSLSGVNFKDMKFLPYNYNTIYVCGANNNWPPSGTNANTALWRLYTDGFVVNWTQIGNNLPALGNDPITDYFGIGVREDQPNTVYAGFRLYNNGGIKYFYKSTSQGASWSLMGTNTSYYIMNGLMDIDVSSNGNFYLGSYYLYKSTNELASLSVLASEYVIHADIRRLLVFPQAGDNDVLIAATDGGVFYSGNNGVTWTDISGNLQINQFYSVSIFDADPNLLLGGTHDCTTLKRTAAGWQNVYYGDGGSTLIDYSDSNRIFYCCNRSLKRSTNGGSSTYSTGITMSALDSPVLQHPTDADTFYAESGGKNIKESTDGGVSWTAFNDGSMGSGDIVAAADICGSNPNYFYYATTTWYYDNGSLIRTTDGGSTWSFVTLPGTLPLSITGIASLEVNDDNPNELWIGLGFFEASHKVYHSSNGGVTWTNISTGLPNFPVNRILYDTENLCLYAGTDVGLYYKAPGMTSWQRYGNGLPYVLVADMKINHSTGKLTAATYGRGMWEVPIYELEYTGIPYYCYFYNSTLDKYWGTFSSGAYGRVQVTSGYSPKSSPYHLTMDVSTSGSYCRNEAKLRLNLSGEHSVYLSFFWKHFNDETHSDDGIYLSDNGGASFVKVFDFNPSGTPSQTWKFQQLDIYGLARANGLRMTDTFVIKFQQYDDYPIPSDGIAIDDVEVADVPW